ncbi:MAG TPA: asparaginase [Rubrivivax sp.]|nr:asparaginase [Rubrivivax sp.]
MNANPVLVEAWRGGSVESSHRGALAVVDAHGTPLLALGDTTRPVFPRSAVKLLQALPLVASGAADALQLSDDELALACASHNGEPAHVAAAAGMLAKAGADPSILECGAHWPYRETFQREMAARGETPTALHNNCSGKHAGFICLACHRAGGRALADYAKGYVRGDHPVMREVTRALQATTGWDLSTTPQGTDGCSIPTFAVPLQHLAHAFARVATGVGLGNDEAHAARRLRRAMAKAPFMVGGSERFDTRVMQRLGERVCCKVGAEGVYCAALPQQGLGVAVKVDDGNNARAAEVVMAALIECFVTLDADEAAWMRTLSDVELRNWNGLAVGRLRASALLRAPGPAA